MFILHHISTEEEEDVLYAIVGTFMEEVKCSLRKTTGDTKDDPQWPLAVITEGLITGYLKCSLFPCVSEHTAVCGPVRIITFLFCWLRLSTTSNIHSLSLREFQS